MQTTYGPNSVDEPSLLYKFQRKIKVFNTNNSLPNRGYNLITCSSKYGLVFIGSPDGILMVYQLKDLIDKDSEPQHVPIQLQEPPTHIAVSCDQELLAVTGGQLLSIYNISNFQNVNPKSLDIKCEVSPTNFVSGLQWNPIIADNLAMVYYDGTILMAHIGSAPQIKKIASKAQCLCWSPKGKQLVTANSDGSLTQYKPDLTQAKSIPAPNLTGGAPVDSLAIYWISTFMFAVVFKDSTDNSRPYVTVINTPKATPSQCLNYEDICYSMGTNRPWYYYLQGIPQWFMIMASSSNSMEIATLGSKDGEVWVQWCQNDEARPELPLTDKKIENYPVGVSIDTCAIHQLPWGENSVLPYMPLLHVLSHNGLLTIFNIINLNKDAPQVCVTPQQLTLPTAAMTSTIPGEAPIAAQPTPASAPVQIQATPIQVAPQAQPAVPPSQYNSATVLNIPKPSPRVNQGIAPVNTEQKPAEIKIPPAQPIASNISVVQQSVVPSPPTAQQTQENAALKAEQERINEIKVNQELKSMLVKEVNDFQRELYRFMVKTKETQTNLQRDIDSINANFTSSTLDSEQLQKECSLDNIRGSLIQLKLELVRTCAVIAEARTYTETKDQHKWTQEDPLTTKRVASVKKLAYYVQTQLDQAQKALNYKWNEAINRDLDFKKPGHRMIRPILDEVYQPLVKQQEILSRQQAVLRTLRNTLNECDVMPLFKTQSLIRTTPFKKDPLSKLTKNILNMSIEPEKPKEPLLSAQKLDALRDILSNHKTAKIKPVNVEMRQHLANMKINYEKSLKDKMQEVQRTMLQPQVKPVPPAIQPALVTKAEMTVEVKQEPKPLPISIPSFTPVGGVKPQVTALRNVARSLFTDESKLETAKPIQISQPSQPKPVPSAFVSQYSPITPASPVKTQSVLKDLLQNKQSNLLPKGNEDKNDANTFMGQAICSPTSFTFSSAAPDAGNTKTTAFTAKPISDITNMFNKFQPQAFVPETKPLVAPEIKPTFATETKPTFVTETKPTFATETKPTFAPETKPTFTPKPPTSESKPQTFTLETKSQGIIQEPKSQMPVITSPKSSETGEAEVIETKTFTLKPKTDKQMTNLFGMKPSTPTTKSNVPDVLKTTQEVKAETQSVIKPTDKENLPDKVESSVTEIKSAAEIKDVVKPKASILGAPPDTVTNTVSSPITSAPKSSEANPDAEQESLPIRESTLTPKSSASSIFAAANASVPIDPKATPTTSSSKVDTELPKPEPSKPSIFSPTSAPSAASIFGAAVASQTTTTSPATSIFASPVASSPPTAFSSQGSIFGSSPTSVFVSTTQPTTTEVIKPSIFSTPTPASPISSSTSAFETTVTTTQSGSIFSSSVFPTSTTSASAKSVFGSSTVSVFGSASTQGSVFGTTTTTPSAFTTATTTEAAPFSSVTTTSAPSAFTPTSTQASVFGSSAITTASSLFGTSGGSVFAGSGATNQKPLFGVPTTSTQASSLFGTATATTQVASVFGTSTTPTTQSSVFGAPVVTTQASLFGSNQQSSVFGTPATTTVQSSSLFGGAETNLFAAASISTTSSPSQSSGGSIFGGSPTGSVFGSANTNVFGSKTTFGQTDQSAASIFGGGGATSFGQKSTNSFWSGGKTNTEGGFGSSGGGFGQQSTTQSSSIFSGSTGGSFSSPSPGGQAFGSPQQNVFGTPQQQTAPAFGGSPTFGANKSVFGSTASFGSPTGFGSSFGGFNKSPTSGFGAPAAFGGAPTFGGGAAFGSTSPGKVFGGATPAPSFTATQSNATFESLANQNTLTFGNLAQQSGQPQQQAPAFNTSASFTGWRG